MFYRPRLRELREYSATTARTFLAHSKPRNPNNQKAYGEGTRNEWVGGKPERLKTQHRSTKSVVRKKTPTYLSHESRKGERHVWKDRERAQRARSTRRPRTQASQGHTSVTRPRKGAPEKYVARGGRTSTLPRSEEAPNCCNGVA